MSDSLAIDMEKWYIEKFNTLYPNGYNLMLGQSLEGGNNKMKGKCLPESWRRKCGRKGEKNERACFYKLSLLDENKNIIFKTRKELANYLDCSIASVKKWMGKEHFDFKTGKYIVFYNLGRINDVREY